jgi:hypothetical protein
MLKKRDIKEIIESVNAKGLSVDEKDVVFLILCDKIEAGAAYVFAHGKETKDMPRYRGSKSIVALSEALLPFGVGSPDEGITKAENKAELIKLLDKLKKAEENKEIEAKDALKIETDIRVKLNDKFEMEEEEGRKRIIVVPQKHDLICPHTHKECTYMPTKEACMKHYNLKEK